MKYEIAVTLEDEVVGAVEAGALETIRERRELGLRLRQGRIHDGDPAVAVLGKDKTSLVIQSEPVGARFAAAWDVARVPRRRQVRLRALSLLPPVDGVLQDVGEQQEAAVLDPDRPFGPFVSFGEDLYLGVGREQFVERRVQALDTWRARRLLLRHVTLRWSHGSSESMGE